MRKALIVAPEFPPSNTAASHRSRLIASHLGRFGWEPTVLTVREEAIEGPLDEGLRSLVPAGLRVLRTAAIPVKPVRWIGDLGLRVLRQHGRAIAKICTGADKPDVLFIPGPPWFTFLLGPDTLKKYRIPYVLDYIDPWTSAYSANASFWSKKGIYHRLALHFEPRVVRAAGHIAAVSEGILEDLRKKYPFLEAQRMTALPYGANKQDFEALSRLSVAPPDFSPSDGNVHFCFTGALQPTGDWMLRGLFSSANRLRQTRGDLFSKLRFHFYGTSNLTWGRGMHRVRAIAHEMGLDDQVSEIPERIDYLKALAVQKNASVNIVMGSTEAYYHASKLYPCLLAGRPLLAVCHEGSSIAQVFREMRLDGCVTFSGEHDGTLVSRLSENLERLAFSGKPPQVEWDRFERYSAEGVAKRLAAIFNQVTDTYDERS